jgi:hypothetical protein
MRFLRAIRFDESDTRVFERCASPGEWAIPGTFVFADAEPESLTGKTRQAFAYGFLGIGSFGWSTFVEVDSISAPAYEATIDALAGYLLAHFGAPDREAALRAARAEAEYAAGLCEHERRTLLAVERSFGDDGINERFKVIQGTSDAARPQAWTITGDGDV